MKKFIVAMASIVILLVGTFVYTKYFAFYDPYTIRVVEASTVRPPEGYRVSAMIIDEDGSERAEVFRNIDDRLFLKTKSGNLQTTLADSQGERLCIMASGLRFSWLSWMPNIIKVVDCE
jgi:hypothetical protein